ncbi:MAG: hypothetical protein Q9160_009229 [Pyrenula sp. 1 TL-2023]
MCGETYLRSCEPASEDEDAESVAAIGTTGSSRDEDHAPSIEEADEWDTLLLSATSEGDNDRVSYILQDQFDPKYLDNVSFEKKASVITSAIELAASNGSFGILRALLRDWGIQCAPEINLLSVIASSAETGAVQTLLESGADIQRTHLVGPSHLTALMAAAQSGHIELIQVLASQGARLDIRNDDGDSAFSLASAQGHVEAARVLLAFGEQSYTHDSVENAKSPMIEAASNGQMEIIQLLLQYKVKAKVSMEDTQTALVAAASVGARECVQMLLEHISDIDFVARFSTKHCIEFANHSLTTALIEAVSNNHAEIVRMLWLRGANVHASDGYCTPLITASYSSSEAIILDYCSKAWT